MTETVSRNATFIWRWKRIRSRATERAEEHAANMKDSGSKTSCTQVKCAQMVAVCTIHTASIKMIIAPYWTVVSPS